LLCISFYQFLGRSFADGLLPNLPGNPSRETSRGARAEEGLSFSQGKYSGSAASVRLLSFPKKTNGAFLPCGGE